MKENSIEEDIKILEEFKTHGYAMLLMKYEDRNKTNLKIDQAIEHILSDYKRVLKENEELKSKNKILEELLQGNLYELYKYYKELAGSYQGNCIPVQKVKDKIEKLNNESHAEKLEDIMNRKNYTITELVQYVLQELLEGRK